MIPMLMEDTDLMINSNDDIVEEGKF